MTEKRLYSSYAGLGRVAMIWGIPLMAALIVFAITVMVALVGAMIFGPGGFFMAVPGVPILIFIRKTCATDDQALRILAFEVRCFLRRTNARLFGNTYTLSPMKYGYRLDVFKQAFERTASLAAHQKFRAKFLAQMESERKANVH
jgi:type IV secretion system protein VirB3